MMEPTTRYTITSPFKYTCIIRQLHLCRLSKVIEDKCQNANLI